MDDYFFKELVGNLAFITKTKYVLISRAVDGKVADFIETVAFFSKGNFIKNTIYAVHNTPCEHVLKGNACVSIRGVQKQFPKDKYLKQHNIESYIGCPVISSSGTVLGHIAIFETEALENEQELITIVQAFASLAASEFERVQMLQALREEEAFNGVVLEKSLDAFIAINVNGEVTRWNKQAEKIFGWTEKEVSGKNLAQFIVPRGKKTACKKGLQRVLITGESHILNKRVEMDAQHRKGHVFPVELTIMPVYADDKITSFAAFIRDITERKNIETALKESEEKLSIAFNTSPDGMAIARLDNGVCVDVNDSFVKLTGISKDVALGKSTVELNIWSSKERQRYKEMLLADHFIKNFETTINRKDGTQLPVTLSANVIKINGEEYIFSVARDVSELKQSQDALEESNWLLALEKMALEMISSGAPVKNIITQTIENIESQSDDSGCLVMLASEDDKYLNYYVSSRLPQAIIELLDGLKIASSVATNHGMAFCSQEYITVTETTSNPFWQAHQQLIQKYKLGRCLTAPIISSDEKFLGVFALFSEKCSEPTEHELQLVDQTVRIFSTALEKKVAREKLLQSEEQFRNAFDYAPTGMVLLDINGNITKVNAAVCQMLGYLQSELLNKHFLDVTDSQQKPESEINYEKLISGEMKSVQVEKRYIHKEGRLVDVVLSVSIVNDTKGNPHHLVAQIDDVTLKKRAELKLQKSENRFRALYDGTPAMFFTINQDNTIASVNKYGAEKLGYQVNELIARSTMDIVLAEDRVNYQASIEDCFLDKDNIHNWEIRKIKHNGSIIWSRESARVIDDVDGTQKILIVSEDITEAHKLSQQLSYQASHDALTGLVNRREFEIRLERLIHEGEGNGEEHALCYMDLDQFKVINDTCGHLAGDELLRQLAELFQSKVRKKDTLARLGGDEFGVLMENCTLEEAYRVAQNLRELVEEFQFVWIDKRFLIGVSIGLVPIDDRGGDATDILSAADAACYAAKDAGRNRVHVYHTEDIDLAEHRGEMQWVSKINHALEDEAKEHYECLIRMIGENGEIILPGAFLPAAERYDLSTKLDRWVFESAYAWMASRPGITDGMISCAVNLSGHSLSNEAFLNFIVSKLDEGKVPPASICFEITETVAISRLSNAIRFMEVLKARGCFFALDDFGSGVSSFGYLKNLPVDFIKIDGMFVRDMINDPIDLAMVRSINEIGHVMGKKTIAEFVENEEIVTGLKELGVDYAQGYHIGKPRPIQVPALKVPDEELAKEQAGLKSKMAEIRKTRSRKTRSRKTD